MKKREVWKSVPGYEGYFASNFGNIKSANKKLKQRLRDKRRKYFCVTLAGNKSVNVHILVCLAFYGLRPKGKEAGHLNGDASDNRVENLAWITKKENEQHKFEHDAVVRGDRHGRRKLNSKEVLQIRDLLKQNWSTQALAHHYGVSQFNIRLIKRRKTWSHL